MKSMFPKGIKKLFCLQKCFLVGMTGLSIVLAAQIPAADMKIAFTSNRDGNSEIYVMNTNGTNPVRLTQNPAADSSPTWSPDGKRIAFTSNPKGVYDIYAINIDGTNRINLTQSSSGDFGADWSPDGKQIVYGSNIGNEEIYIIDADGSNPRNLSRHARADRHPAWSPDGTKIAFSSDREGEFDIYVMNDDGSNPVNLTHNQPGRNRGPAWQPIPLAVQPQEKLVTLWGNLKSKE